MRNTLEDSGSKDLPQERVPLDRNLPASERSVMPRAQNTPLGDCKPTTRHTLNIGRRGFQACRLSPTEKSKEIFWSIILILVGGVAWLTMQNISWGVVDPAKVGLVFAVIGLISLIWALFNKNSDSSRAHETIRNANRSKED